jgi:imidazole glycerol-phosphate synthase subunit HisH
VLADYGAGNLRSVASAFARAGAEPVLSVDPDEVRTAPFAVIAGVGHVASAVTGLGRHGLDDAIRGRATAGRPLLGICVGMQILFGPSEEGGRGLELLGGDVGRLHARRVPHMGWNRLQVARPSALLDDLDGEDVYFAHSYAVRPAAHEVVTATVDHGGEVVAGVESGCLAGVQFHPERSGEVGARVLANALAWAERWSRSA